MQTETERKTEAEHALTFIHFYVVTLEKILHFCISYEQRHKVLFSIIILRMLA